MNIQEIEKAVAALQRTLFKKSATINDGLLKSHLRGTGLHFKEHQVYHPGDDVRFIDWKLTARTNNTYIKTFEEDRNVEVVVIIDLNSYMLYGSRGITKLQVALELLALLYLMAQQSQDLVRAVLLAKERIELPPSRGKEGLVMLLTELDKRKIRSSNDYVSSDNIVNTLQSKDKIATIRTWLSRRKEVLFFGDLADLETHSYFQKLLHESKLHVVRIMSPIDETPLPYSLPESWRKGALIGRNKPIKRLEHQRLITLKTDERYLDRFIKEFN